jgi:quercetin dioxygenase-like cupin family protein
MLRSLSGSQTRRATVSHTTTRPIHVTDDAGEALWWGGGLAVIKASAADTAGQMTILEITEPARAQAPLHVHRLEDEAFWILEGRVTFEVGGQTIEAAAGDYVFGPRDVPHRYTVGEQGCRMLFILTPGGFEGLVRALSRPAEGRGLPPANREPASAEDQARMQRAIEAHGCEIF